MVGKASPPSEISEACFWAEVYDLRTLHDPPLLSNQALFASTYQATIEDVHLVDVEIVGSSNLGAVVGSGFSDLTAITVKGKLREQLVGESQELSLSSVTDAIATVSLIGSGPSIGGLVGTG